MAYSIQTGDWKGSRTLPNSRAIVLHQGGQCWWAGGMKGWLIRAQTTGSKRISCKCQGESQPQPHLDAEIVGPREKAAAARYGADRPFARVQNLIAAAEPTARRQHQLASQPARRGAALRGEVRLEQRDGAHGAVIPLGRALARAHARQDHRAVLKGQGTQRWLADLHHPGRHPSAHLRARADELARRVDRDAVDGRRVRGEAARLVACGRATRLGVRANAAQPGREPAAHRSGRARAGRRSSFRVPARRVWQRAGTLRRGQRLRRRVEATHQKLGMRTEAGGRVGAKDHRHRPAKPLVLEQRRLVLLRRRGW